MSAGPLAGTRVVVTRAESQTAELRGLLAAAGASVEPLPLLAVVPPDEPALLTAARRGLTAYHWVVFTSANAVSALLDAPPAELPSRWPRVAAVGSATAAELQGRGIEVDLVPGAPRAEGLLAELLPRLTPGERVLLPQAEDARPLLADGLRQAGVAVDVVIAYGKRLPAQAAARFAQLFATGPLGWVTFTSPSTARAFAGLAAEAWRRRRQTLRAASIGPVTSRALRQLGVPRERVAEAAAPTAAALVAAIVAAAGTEGPDSREPRPP
ncbi:MAG TPA: uroporphyrinogen-III synthase [Thermoanaerobaculia bacterium]|nr:uroporphyrinogen-III synthase [Thermoanaerobaculia bacterium]